MASYEIEVASNFGHETIEVPEDHPVWDVLHDVWQCGCQKQHFDCYDRTNDVVLVERVLRLCEQECGYGNVQLAAAGCLVGHGFAERDEYYFPF